MSNQKPSPSENSKSKQLKIYGKYSSLAFQMVIIVVIFAWGGMKLDAYQENETPGWSISLTLLGICAALYTLFRSVKKVSND